MTKVLFFWKVRDELKTYLSKGLQEIEDLELIFPENNEEEEYIKLAKDVDVLVGWRPSKKLLNASNELRLFINPGAGIKRLIPKFRELNKNRTQPVILVNGHGNSYFTAQHAVALLFACLNKIVPHHNWMIKGKWRRGDDYAKSKPLRNLTVGLLGYGAINKKVHKFLSGFDVEFAALKQSWPTSDNSFFQYTSDQLDEFLSRIDILILALPHTTKTEGMIGSRELDLLGENGILINVARGKIIQQHALYNALIDKKIAMAALDVWYNYDPEEDEKGRKFPFKYPFHELDNVVLSPHRGASPMDDLLRWDEVIVNIRRVCQGKDNFLNTVDLEREY